MSNLLHIAIPGARGRCCISVKDEIGHFRQNVAMAKKSASPKKPGHYHRQWPGHYLRQWREFRNLTQEGLAAKVKPPTNASVISLLESGDRGLSNKWLARLAVALGTKKGFILDMNPYATEAAILEVWGLIPEDDRPKVRTIMEAFVKKTASGG